MKRPNNEFNNQIDIALELSAHQPTARMLLLTVVAMLAVGLTWAHFAVLEEVTRGFGRIVPSQQTQLIQSLEGGIIDEILIDEGAIVKKGQPLMRISDIKFAAELGEVRERRAATASRVARLEAEAQGQSKIHFGEGIGASHAAIERSAFEARARKLALELDTLRQQELRLTDMLAILAREVSLTQNLFKQKIVPELDMLRLERLFSEMRGQLAEAKSKIEYTTAAFRAQSEEELVKSRGDLAVLDETIKSAQDRLRRTELHSPVYGIVNKVNVTTLGSVVQPAATLIELIPLDDTLLVESRIHPHDIAFIRPRQEAVVKLTAYDPSIYGSLRGKVERIGADAIVDEKDRGRDKNETFYRVMIRTDKNHLGTSDNPLPIIPGMVASVEILTDEKSVLDRLLRPIRMLRDSALRER